ncbi:NmrA family NAD(P)-binding protein [Actinoplanes sp. NPDC051346]|uniref:NmrA family NAD(P)-binding protein n=1 Tax=Actinoplanes sp. NPDC051346 TaxID=3155048 RepID=UPI0034483219
MIDTASADSRASKPILVIGGTGKTGSRVVRRLADAGRDVRVGSRSAQPPFDWEDQATWPTALDGVGGVYISYYPDLAFPGAVESIASLCKLAVDAGVERLVLLSGRGEEAAREAEKVVQGAGVAWTVVRCSWFNQNFSESFFLDPVLAGEIALPAGDAPEPFVDADDIADVAVAALTGHGHAGQVYELTGPRLLTFADVADELSRATGREIHYVRLSREQYADLLREYGQPTEFVELFDKILDGRNASLTDGVQRALGRRPKDFAEYARVTAAQGVWS